MTHNIKILDCTFRDGGYYTNWDFDDKTIDAYIKAMNALPVEYLELGYRNLPLSEYMGKMGYSPVSALKRIRENCTKKLCVMLDEKNTRPHHLQELLVPISGLVEMVRLAVDPKNFDRAVVVAKAVKDMGFEVGFNTMYMSKWNEYDDFVGRLGRLDGVADLFCMVDSYGGMMPEEVRDICHNVKSKMNCAVGFHGHNNLQMGLVNTLASIDAGCEFVDATILGMGRGAGNVNMELLLTILNKRGLEVDFNVLGEVVETFKPLHEKYQWGTNLPYMISGANSIPQKEVMDWVGNRTYSFNSIVRALENKKNQVADNARYPVWMAAKANRVLIVGGGPSVIEHCSAIKEFLQNNKDLIVVFATSRHAQLLNDIANAKEYCLVGNEAKRMKTQLDSDTFNGICVLPPYPRTMGTEVPEFAENATFELPEIAFTKSYLDSCTATALNCAIEHKATEVFVVGYDGYRGAVLSEKEADLSNENRTLFEDFRTFTGLRLVSLVPTVYKALNVDSIYKYL